MSRRTVLRALVGAGVLGAAGGVGLVVGRGDETGAGPGGARTTDLEQLADEVVSGGPPKDGIPPIDEPVFVAADDASFLTDDDVVFGLVRGGEARAYPQLVLVWHEIVNDQFADGPLSVTYCPLTGSAVAFRGTAPNGEAYTFGTSGDLVNSNLLMYDRQTDSRWPQILGQAISGPVTGAALEEIPVLWTTWGRWRSAHPDTVALSTETGAIRNYGGDPYGSYTPLGGYYQPDSAPFFPVVREDDRFPPKQVMIGAKRGDARLAVLKDLVREQGVVAASLADRPVAVLYDADLDDARAFLAEVDGRPLDLAAAEPGRFRGADSDGLWDAAGRSVSGGPDLERVVSYDVMWFSWAAFFPDTEVVA